MHTVNLSHARDFAKWWVDTFLRSTLFQNIAQNPPEKTPVILTPESIKSVGDPETDPYAYCFTYIWNLFKYFGVDVNENVVNRVLSQAADYREIQLAVFGLSWLYHHRLPHYGSLDIEELHRIKQETKGQGLVMSMLVTLAEEPNIRHIFGERRLVIPDSPVEVRPTAKPSRNFPKSPSEASDLETQRTVGPSTSPFKTTTSFISQKQVEVEHTTAFRQKVVDKWLGEVEASLTEYDAARHPPGWFLGSYDDSRPIEFSENHHSDDRVIARIFSLLGLDITYKVTRELAAITTMQSAWTVYACYIAGQYHRSDFGNATLVNMTIFNQFLRNKVIDPVMMSALVSTLDVVNMNHDPEIGAGKLVFKDFLPQKV